jgi:multidrug transporter EmrE-like cation transporter
MNFSQFLQVLLISTTNAVAQVFLKKAEIKEFNFAVLGNKMVWIGAILYVAAFGLWVKIINELEMGVAVPIMTGIMYVLSLFAAWYFFKEQMTVVKVVAVALIFAGILLLAKK